ncbi:MAG: DUF2784 family protein [Chthoniobacteraceae bacterium]
MRALNWIFHGFHIGLTLFTAVGWMVPAWRHIHLAVCALTLFSWFGIGLVLGKPGFCAITEIHFHIRRRLGLSLQRESYMLYLTRKLIGSEPNSATVEIGTQVMFYTVTLLSLALTVFT